MNILGISIKAGLMSGIGTSEMLGNLGVCTAVWCSWMQTYQFLWLSWGTGSRHFPVDVFVIFVLLILKKILKRWRMKRSSLCVKIFLFSINMASWFGYLAVAEDTAV